MKQDSGDVCPIFKLKFVLMTSLGSFNDVARR